jgi:hypothetical protein
MSQREIEWGRGGERSRDKERERERVTKRQKGKNINKY